MAVKRSHSATRVLTVLEKISHNQPIGVSALARLMDDNKSAVQRAIMTLADAGWIRPVEKSSGQWELTPHILTLARPPSTGDALKQRVRHTLAGLSKEFRETVFLTIPDKTGFVVIDTLESPKTVRMVASVGLAVPVRGSSTGLAILPWLGEEEQISRLGSVPDEVLLKQFKQTRNKGYAVSVGGVESGSFAVASAIFDADARPEGAIVVSGPIDRFSDTLEVEIGEAVLRAARQVSRASPTDGISG